MQVITTVKSPFSSKVNWILLGTACLDIANQALPLVPIDDRGTMSLYITLGGAVLGIVAKTFYTTEISSASIPSATPISTIVHNEHDETEALNIAQLKK
jgi:hypothetical protein